MRKDLAHQKGKAFQEALLFGLLLLLHAWLCSAVFLSSPRAVCLSWSVAFSSFCSFTANLQDRPSQAFCLLDFLFST